MTTRPDPLVDALRDALGEEDFAEEGDDALLARAVSRAAATLEATPAEPAPVVRLSERARMQRRRTLRIVVPLAAAFAASVAMAAVIATRSPAPANDAPKTTDTAPPPAPSAVKTGATVAPSPDTTPSMSVSDLPNAKVAPSGPHGSSSVGAPAIDAPAAADLFRDANSARRAGDVKEAVVLYKRLQQAHPGSSESHASRVTLGRLLLDKQGDAAGALEQFDAYLRNEAMDGALAEEARIGRAQSLQKMGKKDAERKAWEELIARHPQSLYVTRAKERLAELAQP